MPLINPATAFHDKEVVAPIVIFAYNRVKHLIKTIDSLKQNKEYSLSDLIIYVDGPKNKSDEANVFQVVDFVKKINGFKSLRLNFQSTNIGLENSIVNGLNEVLSNHDKVIVVEDDLIVSDQFLSYMNQGLNLYSKDQNVASIHGYVYPVKEILPDYFFLRGADCWGWATWKRAWEKYNSNGHYLYNKIIEHPDVNLFDFNGQGRYVKMLEDANSNKIQSWAVKWYASAFLANMYTLYPGKSLVKNLGLDGSGTHIQIETDNRILSRNNLVKLKRQRIEENSIARLSFERYFAKSKLRNIRNLPKYIKLSLKIFLNKVIKRKIFKKLN